MPLLLAILLAFLAQNLITPWPYDFAAVCGVIGVVGLMLVARSGSTGKVSLLWPGLVLLALVAVWQLLPSGMAAGVLFVAAGALFVFCTLEERVSPNSTSPAGGQYALFPPAQYGAAKTFTGWEQEPAPQDPPVIAAPARTFPRWAEVVLLALMVLGAGAASLYDNGSIPPGLHGDEAESGIEARNLNANRYTSLIGVGWYDQPLASFLVQAYGLRLFGDNVAGLRTTSALISLLSLPLLYILVRRLFGVRVALLATALTACAHWFIAYAHIGINYNQTLLLELLAIWTFWEGWQTRKWHWWLICGLATGAGLYLYFASRLVPILLAVFGIYLWWRGRTQSKPDAELPGMPLKQAIVAGVVALLIFAPMGLFFVEHAKEFNSRAAFVFLFSDTQFNTAAEKMKIYTGSTDVPSALMVQIYRYATTFNVSGDRSGQYGNTLPLLDYYTSVFFVLGLAYALFRMAQPRYLLLLLWLSLTLFIGGVLTIESPFTPRIIGAMPVPFILAALALDRLLAALQNRLRGEWPARVTIPGTGRIAALTGRAYVFAARTAPAIPAALLTLILSATVYFNGWVYFERYLHSIDGWAQRESATSIARYAEQMQSDQTLYVLSAPELYVWHGTIRFLAPNLRGYDLIEPDSDLPVRDAVTQRATFVMLPNYLKWLPRLRELYPNGEYKEFRRVNGDLWYTLYEVPAADIAARRTR